MKSRRFWLVGLNAFGLLGLTLVALGCWEVYSYHHFNSRIPANYSAYQNYADSAADYLAFNGVYNPAGPFNGQGNNTLYTSRFPSAAPTILAPSALVGTIWVGRMGDALSPQLTLGISSDQLTLTLDCYISSGNILEGINSVTLPIKLDGNRVYLSNAFRIINRDRSDFFNYCSLTLNSDGFQFSNATGPTATVKTLGNINIGTFVRQ